jgi:erythromycin esterase
MGARPCRLPRLAQIIKDLETAFTRKRLFHLKTTESILRTARVYYQVDTPGESPRSLMALRMKPKYLILLLFTYPIALHGQSDPIQAFQEWARDHVHPIASVEESPGDADLQPLRAIIGDAHLIAFGEPFHGGHEPLAMRNRMIRYGVTQLGFTAVALETCLSSSKRLYDHILGHATESDAGLKEAFCYGFGDYPENLELIQWLRTYNTGQPSARQVHLYGIDLSGQYFPTAYRSLEDVLNYLDRADPALGHDARSRYADLIPVFRSDRYTKLTAAEKDACTGKIQDLIALIRRERTPLAAATSLDDYEWALRQAVSAAQDDVFLRSLPSEFDQSLPNWWERFKPDLRWDHNAEMREVAMADNVLWVMQRECRRGGGKVLFFAHDEHIQAGPGILGSPGHPPAGQYREIRGAGSYLRSALGPDLAVIGTYFGRVEKFGAAAAGPPGVHDVEDLLTGLSVPQFFMDLRELPAGGPLYDFFATAHGTSVSVLREAVDTVTPLKAYDVIFFC